MKEIGKTYCDISKYYIKPTTKDMVYDMIMNKHYAKRWAGASLIFGIYEYGTKSHDFFNIVVDKLVGCIVYGSPVARHGVKSISDSLEFNQVLELKRLWVDESAKSNIESYSISQSIKYIKVNHPEVKVLISYADPMENHLGMIYRASNWKYQGDKISHAGALYQYKFKGTDKWVTPRSVNNKLGVCGLPDVLKLHPTVEYKPIERKHRYIYLTCPKKEKKLLIKSLKHPLIKYKK